MLKAWVVLCFSLGSACVLAEAYLPFYFRGYTEKKAPVLVKGRRLTPKSPSAELVIGNTEAYDCITTEIKFLVPEYMPIATLWLDVTDHLGNAHRFRIKEIAEDSKLLIRTFGANIPRLRIRSAAIRLEKGSATIHSVLFYQAQWPWKTDREMLAGYLKFLAEDFSELTEALEEPGYQSAVRSRIEWLERSRKSYTRIPSHDKLMDLSGELYFLTEYPGILPPDDLNYFTDVQANYLRLHLIWEKVYYKRAKELFPR